MKLQSVKPLFKKTTKTAIFSLIIASMLTGCSIEFSRNPESSGVTETSQQFVTQISQAIEDVEDLTDKETLQEFAYQIAKVSENEAKANEMLSHFERASVVRVVDGDTIVVEIQAPACGNKEEVTVRLIGVDTPESVANKVYLEKTGKENTQEGITASDYTKDLLSHLDYVYLQKDKSNKDPYDRLLRYVWLEVPTNEWDINEISSKMLQGVLLKDKIAVPVSYDPDTAYQRQFEEIYDME